MAASKYSYFTLNVLLYALSLLSVTLAGVTIAFYNGSPIVFDDSMGYFNTLKHGMVSHVRPSYYVDVFKWLVGPRPFYWLVLQSLFQAIVLHLVWSLIPSRLFEGAVRRALILSAFVLFTPLGFESSYLMPDFSGGLMLLTAAATLAFWSNTTFKIKFLLCSFTVLFLSFHISNIPLLVFLLIAASFSILFSRGVCEKSWEAVIVLTVLAIGITLSINLRNVQDLKISSPAPAGKLFAFARFYELGPVKEYIQEGCAQKDVAPSLTYFCDAHTKIPEDWDAQLLLWHGDSPFAAFRETSDERYLSWRDLRTQVSPILEAAVVRSPGAFAYAFLKGGWEQLWRISLSDAFGFGREPLHMHNHLVEAVFSKSDIARFKSSKQYQQKFPMKELTVLYTAAYYIGLLLLVLLIRISTSPEQQFFLCMLLVGILANALICGGLSGLDGRYQLRVAWVPLFAASLVLFKWRFPPRKHS